MYWQKLTLVTSLFFSVFLFFVPHLTAQEVEKKIEVLNTYSSGRYGPIEVKRDNQPEWEKLKRGNYLTIKDWIRMPKASKLRLKDGDKELPTFTDAQMRTVAGLLQLAKDKLPSESIDPTGHQVERGGMPRGTRPSPQQHEQPPNQSSQGDWATQEALDQLLSIVPEFNPALQQAIPNISSKQPYQEIPNIGRALWLFDQLREPEMQPIKDSIWKHVQDRFGETFGPDQQEIICNGLLYYAQLTSAGIPVKAFTIPHDLTTAADGLYMEVSSGVTMRNQITINPRLVQSEADSFLLPLYVSPAFINFAQAWYEGAQLKKELQK